MIPLCKRSTVILFGVAVCVAVHALGEDAEKLRSKADSDTLTQIVQAWKSREARVQSPRFEWKETRTSPSIFEYAGLVRGLSPQAAKRVAMPPERTHERTSKLSFQGNSVRYEYEGPQWIEVARSYAPRIYVAAFDGELATTFFGSDRSGLGAFEPVGFVNPKENHPDSLTLVFRALSLAYRPLQPSLGGFSPEDYEVCQYEDVGGHRCALIKEKANSTNPNGTWYWVDPKQDWMIVRTVSFWRGKPTNQLDISYAFDKTHGWTPAAWKATLIKSGEPKTWFSANVTRWVINPSIPRSDFRLEFPVGTWVNDRVQKCEYIVREGNARRIITKDESSMP